MTATYAKINTFIRRSGYSVALAEQEVDPVTHWANPQENRLDLKLEPKIDFAGRRVLRHLTMEEQGVLVRALRRSVRIVHKARRN